MRKRKWLGVAAILMAVVLVAALWWFRKDIQKTNALTVVARQQQDVGGGYRIVEYQGRTYRYNNRVTTILYAGIDSDTDIESTVTYTMAPRADSISLVVMDTLNERLTIIALNRDTMTQIHRFTLNGKDRGLFQDHLAHAYTYGDGGSASCENLCDAVSNLLCGIPIDGYVVSNRASLPLIADLVGPVEVTVPNDDLAAQGYVAGQTAVIDGSNLEFFVRSRDTGKDLSNVSRMQRQQAYIEGCISTLMNQLTRDPTTVWRKVEQAEKSVLTDITRSRYLDLTKVLKNVQYSEGSYLTPEGEQVVGPEHDEFYPDQDRIRDMVIDLFYIEA